MTTRKLTTSQQVRLTQYLDDELLNVERDVNKRTDPESPIPSLSTLINRLTPIMNLIMSIPSSEPTGYIRIQYLLRFTSGMREWFSGYSITGQGVVESISAAQRRTRKNSSKLTVEASRRSLKSLLEFVERLDLAWMALLTGISGRETTSQSDQKVEVKEEAEDALNNAQSGSYRNLVSITDKIRLRSSILSLRERILSWAEKQSYLLAEAKEGQSAEQSETDLPALEDEVENEAESMVDDDGVFRWGAEIVNSMRRTLEALDL